jgi:hypothetical protein
MTREQALKDAFLQSIRYVGLTTLKATSMFGSSERSVEVAKAA